MSEIAAASSSTPSTRPLLWGRLGSLLGILPLGVWIVNHLWDNLSAFLGKEAWEKEVTGFDSPLAHALTLTVVLLPLLLHTVWGLQRIGSARPNNLKYFSYDNLKYLLQRLSALGLLGFLGAHLFLAMVKPRILEGHPEHFEDIASKMAHHFPTLAVYVLGTLAVSYHLANGISGFAWSFGLVSGRRTYRGLDKVALVAFALLLALSWGAIYALYTAGQPLPVAVD